MSLINDMLRDLDRRRAGMGKTPSLAAVPASRQPPSRRRILIVLAIAIIGGGASLLAAYWLGQKAISPQAPPLAVYQGKTRAVTPDTPITPARIVHPSQQARISPQPTLLAVVPSPQGAAIPGLWLTFSAPLTLSPLPAAGRMLQIGLAASLARRLPTAPAMMGIATLRFTRTHSGILLLARATTGFRLRLVSVPKADPAHSILALQARPIATAKLNLGESPGRAGSFPHAELLTSQRRAGRAVVAKSRSRAHASKAQMRPSTPAPMQRRITRQAKLPQVHSISVPGKSTGGSVTVRSQPVSAAVRAHQAYNRAMQDLAAGHTLQGTIALQRTLTIDPQVLPARLLLAGLEAKAGRLQSALALLDAGLTLRPNASRSLSLVRLQARILIDAGHPKRALEVLKKNAPAVSAAPDYYALLAGLEVQAGHYRQAAHRYAALLTLSPDRAVWWLGLGIALDQSGQDQAALKAYQNALQYPGLSSASETYAQRRIKALGGGKP